MRAVYFEQFAVPPVIAELSDPTPDADGVVLRVESTGLCRSDWHGWLGHDPDIALPHVPGHELAGTVVAVGAEVRNWRPGQRVVTPFVCACGTCDYCRSGNQQVCSRQQQPGFTYWGSFAEYVAIPFAEVNLVELPEAMSFDTAAALGCRFATSFRAVTQVADVQPGEWTAVFGCGGVGLSAVMIAAARGARVIAVDPSPAALAMALEHGAEHAVLSAADNAAQLRDLSGGGLTVAFDAIGAESAIQHGLNSLVPRGRFVQIGLLPQPVRLDLSALAFRELTWSGSHGLAARHFPAMLDLVASGAVRPDQLVTATIALDAVPDALRAMSEPGRAAGVTVIRPAR